MPPPMSMPTGDDLVGDSPSVKPGTLKASFGSLTARQLPVEEWDRLREFGPFKVAGGLPNPSAAVVLVLENAEGEIVGSWMVRNMALLEGLYFDASIRHSMSAAKSILLGMLEILDAQGVGQAMTLASSPAIERLSTTAGFVPLPGRPYLLERRKGT